MKAMPCLHVDEVLTQAEGLPDCLDLSLKAQKGDEARSPGLTASLPPGRSPRLSSTRCPSD